MTEENIAKRIFSKAKGDITYEEILDIVRQNPGLLMDQYRLLLQLHQQTGRLGLLLSNGFTELELHGMISVGFLKSDFGTLVNRIQTALRSGTDRPGDPDGLTVQQIHDLAVNVAEALSSSDPGTEFEGKTALSVLPDLVRCRQICRWPDGSMIVDIDAETAHAIIEVTNAPDGKRDQVNTLLNNTIVNPRRKPIILFAPGFTPGAMRAAEQVDPDNVHGAKTWQDLKEWLRLLGD